MKKRANKPEERTTSGFKSRDNFCSWTLSYRNQGILSDLFSLDFTSRGLDLVESDSSVFVQVLLKRCRMLSVQEGL
ncbi:MAG: hypothetical protein DRQ24_07060 [Candidatus Latescibacterota bacterium]|nr:MAG: hypothetical protein DRQ24_07060 [Candidatus Latescibacterota bacterium]